MKKISFILFAVILFSLGVKYTIDPDLWWHLKTGEVIAKQGIPETDLFSFTVPGTPWTAHEWLSDLLLWNLHQIGGFKTLAVFFGFITVLTFFLVYFRSPGRPYLAIFFSVLAFLASDFMWRARPQVFNILFLAFYLLILDKVRWKEWSSKWLFLLCPATLLWANFHSGFLMGILVLGVYLAGDFLDQYWFHAENGVFDRNALKRLAAVLTGSVVLACFNPQGIYIFVYPFGTLLSPAMKMNILEWWSPDFRMSIFWPYLILLNLGIAGFMLQKKRISLTDAFLFLGTASAGLMSMRHIPFFAVFGAPLIARNFDHFIQQYHFKKTRLWKIFNKTSSEFKLSLITVMAASLLMFASHHVLFILKTNEESIRLKYPVKAVDFLEMIKMKNKRGFNEYSWGGYLIWRGIPVFIDGRADMYRDGFFLKYLNTYYMQEHWQDLLKQYEVDYILLPAQHPLSQLTELSGDWVQVYNDGIAFIALRSKYVELLNQ